MDHIKIFKTNIQTEDDLLNLAGIFNNHPLVEKWNVDLLDCDKVLRVITRSLSEEEIISLVRGCHLACTELPD
jgi:cell fate (sporulation/competence/biofilm development) regulator YmcA (YheA/YmcA/DUF963 family)